MKSSTLTWTACMALLSLQGATADGAPTRAKRTTAPQRPNYYLPRHLKRQTQLNATALPVTSPDSSPTPQLSAPAVVDSSSLTSRDESSQANGDLAVSLGIFPQSDTDASSLLSTPLAAESSTYTVVIGSTIIIESPSGTSTVISDTTVTEVSSPFTTVTLSSTPEDAQPTPSASSFLGTGGVVIPVVTPSAPVDSQATFVDTSILQSSTPDPSSSDADGTSNITPQSTHSYAGTGGVSSPVIQPTSNADSSPVASSVESQTPAFAGTGGISSPVIQPTASNAESPTAETGISSAAGTGTGGISIPIVQPTSAETSVEADPTSSDASTGLLDPIVSPLASVLGTGGVLSPVLTPTTVLSSEEAVSSAAAGTGDVLSPVLNPTTSMTEQFAAATGTGGVLIPVVTPTSAIPGTDDSTATSSAGTGIIIGLSTIIDSNIANIPPSVETSNALGGLVSGVTSAVASAINPVATPVGSLVASLPAHILSAASSVAIPAVASSGESALATGALLPDVTIPTTDSDLLSLPITSDLDTIINGIVPTSSGASDAASTSPSSEISLDTGLLTGIGSILSSILPSTPLGLIPTTPAIPLITPTAIDLSSVLSSLTGTPSAVSTPVTTTGPSKISTNSSAAQTPSSITPLPTTPGSVSKTTSTTASSSPAASETPESSVETPSTIISLVPSPTVATSTSPTTSNTPIFSIRPTGTDSATTYIVATSIVFDPSTAGVSSASTATASATTYPKFIAPPGGMPVAPTNYTKIQIGFKRGFNWPFVVGHADTTGWQLTTYMPIAVADGLGIDHDRVQMVTLTSYNTTKSLGYISTLALMNVPSDLVDTLHLDLLMPNSAFYNNNDEGVGSTINFLTSFVDPTFPILASDLPDDSASGSVTGSGTTSSSSGSGSGGDPMGDDSSSSSTVNGSAVGIAFAAIGGVAVYGAAMMFVARRYKNKRAGHQRSSSLPSADSANLGSFRTTPWMSGSHGDRESRGSHGSGSRNGRSARTAQISAPVMAENSLGWN